MKMDWMDRLLRTALLMLAIAGSIWIAIFLWGCSTQPPEDVQALQSVMQDPNVPLNVKGQYLNWWNAEKDEQRAQMQRNYENALNLGMMTGAASAYQVQQPQIVQPIVPWYVTHPTPAAMGYTNPWGRSW